MARNPASDVRAADRYFSSHEVGQILQVTPSSVVKWIHEGILQAFRTPGGHRRVSATELVRFAQEHGMPIPDSLRDLAVSTVLVVAAEPRFVAALEKAFGPYASEFNLRSAEGGIDGLLLVGTLNPDVLVFDVGLKGVDGFEVLERVRANPETSHTVVIAIGAKMDEAAVKKCTELGAALCLRKPVNVGDLVETLRSLRKVSSRGR